LKEIQIQTPQSNAIFCVLASSQSQPLLMQMILMFKWDSLLSKKEVTNTIKAINMLAGENY
jgi:hypothetical protein